MDALKLMLDRARIFRRKGTMGHTYLIAVCLVESAEPSWLRPLRLATEMVLPGAFLRDFFLPSPGWSACIPDISLAVRLSVRDRTRESGLAESTGDDRDHYCPGAAVVGFPRASTSVRMDGTALPSVCWTSVRLHSHWRLSGNRRPLRPGVYRPSTETCHLAANSAVEQIMLYRAASGNLATTSEVPTGPDEGTALLDEPSPCRTFVNWTIPICNGSFQRPQ